MLENVLLTHFRFKGAFIPSFSDLWALPLILGCWVQLSHGSGPPPAQH